MLADEEPKVVFASSVEALFRAFGPPWDEPTRAALGELGLDPERPPQAAYPLDLYMSVMAALVRVHFPEGSHEERYAQLGRAFIAGFDRTFVGRAQLAVLRLIGPRRTLQRLTRSFRAVNNYAETELRTLSPVEHELVIRFVQEPGFYLGVLQAGLREAGATNLKVALAERQGMSATYAIQWR